MLEGEMAPAVVDANQCRRVASLCDRHAELSVGECDQRTCEGPS